MEGNLAKPMKSIYKFFNYEPESMRRHLQWYDGYRESVEE